jgi:tripartite-type tricarboxylate transporter receptor subunit TctC
MPDRRTFVAAAALLAAPLVRAQEAWPNKPLKIIVPFPPGGSVDPLARVVARHLQEALGQPVIVENRPGGNTLIGTDATAKAPADGHTLLMTATSHVTTPLLSPAPFDPIKDFAPVSTLSSADMILVVNPSVQANNLSELIALAKSRPGALNYGSAGNGNPNHLAGELFDMMAGVKTTHIPYKGGAPAINDLVGGQVQMAYGSPIIVLPFIRSGKLRAIAVTSPSRMASLPQVPTLAEAGLPGYAVKIWYGVLAPGATPKPVVARLGSELGRIMQLADVKDVLDAAEMERFVLGPEPFGAQMAADTEKFRRIIATANVKL